MRYQSTNTSQSTNGYKWPKRVFVGIRNIRRSGQGGFSLIEMMVAVALFAIVMLISTGSLLSLIDANRKAQALQSVMDNLNIAVDGMVRAVRMGSTYHCGGPPYDVSVDCSSGGTTIAFEPFGGDPDSSSDQHIYQYNSSDGRLYRSTQGGQSGTFFAITAPEITIDDMQFYVVGTQRGDTTQPKVVITIRGTAGSDRARITTTFSMQSTASQRILDL